ncbi:hypothetical protein TRIP_D310272 [uncultured Paludibacter sp.]|nr:hypothetical protein TRIP_D310272 [uncultured Paludibacter sp.]
MSNRNFSVSLHSQKTNGTIAQLVEQRTENPCVPGSIPGGTTERIKEKTGEVFSFIFN